MIQTDAMGTEGTMPSATSAASTAITSDMIKNKLVGLLSVSAMDLFPLAAAPMWPHDHQTQT